MSQAHGFGVWLKQERTAAGLTIADLSRLSGIRPDTLTDLERGKAVQVARDREKVTRIAATIASQQAGAHARDVIDAALIAAEISIANPLPPDAIEGALLLRRLPDDLRESMIRSIRLMVQALTLPEAETGADTDSVGASSESATKNTETVVE